jgi:hypothetical protein
MLNLRLKPVIGRLLPNLYSNIETGCLPSGHDGTGFLPRLATCRYVRAVTLRFVTDQGRVMRIPMTPEEAYDLGTALTKAAMASGRLNTANGGNGYAVNTRRPADGWTTATLTGIDRKDFS